ncbi:hypothetical protein GCM10027451_15780 [Geodermatophilus aquaeductus]
MTLPRRALARAQPAAVALAGCGVLALGCAAAVAGYGELHPGSLVAVAATGTLIAGVGLIRRTGAGSPSEGRLPSAPLLLWAVLAVVEVVALLHDDVPTVSDLVDPALAVPAVRAAATLVWCAVGAWLVARPPVAVATMMRRPAGRLAVLASWLWLGVHFLAR